MNDVLNNILASTKRLAQLSEEYDAFDIEIIMYINSVFLVLKQLGVGPKEGFVITSGDALWTDFLPGDDVLRENVKAYMGAKTRLQFDPPTASSAMDALNRIINEFEWRLNTDVETTW